jgi:hypothetical protein
MGASREYNKMNRRSFLKFCGVAPVVPSVIAINPVSFNDAADNFCFSTFKPDIIVDPKLSDKTWIKKRNCLIISLDLEREAREIVADMINRHYGWS